MAILDTVYLSDQQDEDLEKKYRSDFLSDGSVPTDVDSRGKAECYLCNYFLENEVLIINELQKFMEIPIGRGDS